jgi:hypothetical protein
VITEGPAAAGWRGSPAIAGTSMILAATRRASHTSPLLSQGAFPVPRGAGGSAMLTTCAAWRERRSARSSGALFRIRPAKDASLAGRRSLMLLVEAVA